MKPARTLDAFPTYEQCPGVQGYLPVTSPVTPRLTDDPLPRLVPECFMPGPPGSLEDFLAYDVSLLDSAADLPQLAIPLLPLPGDLHIFPDCQVFRYQILITFLAGSRTTSSFMTFLSGPLVGTPECSYYIILCCIYVAGLIRAGCLPTSEYCVTVPFWGFVTEQGLVHSSMFVYSLCISGGGGSTKPMVGGGGGLSQSFKVSPG